MVLQKHPRGSPRGDELGAFAVPLFNPGNPFVHEARVGSRASGRTIKRLARLAGTRLKRGRPPTAARVQKRDLYDLIETTSNGFTVSGENALHFFHELQLQFGLTPQQYLKWVTQSVRRGKSMMRKCLFSGDLFPSTGSGERHCRRCQSSRRHLVKEEGRSVFL